MSVRNAVDFALDPEVVVFLVLGAGITAAFFDLGFAGLIFAVGFAVLLPLSDILSRKLDTDEETDSDAEQREQGVDTADDTGGVDESAALETLRERYARGEIDEMEFERRVADLLATESVGEAREFAERRTGAEDRDETSPFDREPERDRR
jgi:uncharacterized membrane protein